LDNGRRIILLLVVLLTAVVYAGVDDEQVFRDSFESIASIRITPGTVLLTVQGESQALTAEAFDEEGQSIADVDFIWTSNDEATVTVDSAGKITAVNSIGSALITVHAADAQSAPVLVLIAEPVANSILIGDEQVVGDPEAIDPEAEYVLGFQYRVILTNIGAPQIGDILLGKGEQPVGGRVVSVVDLGNGQFEVTLELIGLDEMFANLVIDEEIDLSEAEFEVPEQVAQLYDVSEESDGTLIFTPKASAEAQLAVEQQPTLIPSEDSIMASADPLVNLGPFKCEVTGSLPVTLPTLPSVTLNRNLNFNLVYDSNLGGLQKITVKGVIGAEAKVKLIMVAALNLGFECKAKFATITIPIGGPAALIFGGQVPIGTGFAISGKLTFLQLGTELSAKGNASAEMGLKCPGGLNCTVIQPEPVGSFDADYKFVVPDPNNVPGQVEFEPKLGGFLYAELAIGPRFIPSLQFKAFELKIGPNLAANLGFVERQILDENYRSDYKLTIDSTIGPGSGLSTFLNFLGLTGGHDFVKYTVDLAESPKALSFTMNTFYANSGETMTGTLKLDPTTVNFTPFGYNVERILLYHSDGTNMSFVREFHALSGQTEFELSWVTLPSMVGNPNFYAFVDTSVLPHVPLFTELEQTYGCPSIEWLELVLGDEDTIANEDDTLIDGQVGGQLFTEFGFSLKLEIDQNTGAVVDGEAGIYPLPCSDPNINVVSGTAVSGNLSGHTLTVEINWPFNSRLQSDQCEAEYDDRMLLPETTSFTLEWGEPICADVGGFVAVCAPLFGTHDLGAPETSIVYGVAACN
jgi:hypothetical protein